MQISTHVFISCFFFFFFLNSTKKKPQQICIYPNGDQRQQTKTRLVTPPMTSHFSNHKSRSLRSATITVKAHCRLQYI